jgi:hypothetical protein
MRGRIKRVRPECGAQAIALGREQSVLIGGQFGPFKADARRLVSIGNPLIRFERWAVVPLEPDFVQPAAEGGEVPHDRRGLRRGRGKVLAAR